MRYLRPAEYLLKSIHSSSLKRTSLPLWIDADKAVEFMVEKCGVEPMLVGGLAVQHYGYRRGTNDINFVLSTKDYDKMSNTGGIMCGSCASLVFDSAFYISVDKCENIVDVRSYNRFYPTLEGLITLKIRGSRREKDETDIVELIKANRSEIGLKGRISRLLPNCGVLESLWERAIKVNSTSTANRNIDVIGYSIDGSRITANILLDDKQYEYILPYSVKLETILKFNKIHNWKQFNDLIKNKAESYKRL